MKRRLLFIPLISLIALPSCGNKTSGNKKGDVVSNAVLKANTKAIKKNIFSDFSLEEEFSSLIEEETLTVSNGFVIRNNGEQISFFSTLLNEEVASISTTDTYKTYPSTVAGGYISCVVPEGLLLVHARRAHVTILYHQLLAQLQIHRGVSQQLLFAEPLTLSAEEQPVLEALLPELRYIGFELEKVSADTYDITAMPSVLGNQSAEISLRAILARSADSPSDLQADMQQRIALTLAQSAAIPTGKNMSEAEMSDLLEKLFALPSSRITPDGKTVAVLLSAEDIARRF